MSLDAVPLLEVDALLDDPQTRIIVCCGAGGVGKTTSAAALGVRAAERGRRAVVLTIDPARRLAQSMGLDELDNTPREVAGVDTSKGGRLHAMMLDMKRTFDEIVEAHADPERARAILDNPFYASLSAGFAGTQEYMAMEKLGQLRGRDEWDLIIVDTPPSRSALDFLDAPKRLGSFLDGRFIRLLTAPAKAGGRAGMKFVNLGMAGLSMVTGTLGKLLGTGLLRDVQTFIAAMDTMFGGFRKRADATYQLLQAPGTAFLVVAAPERDALREAAYFVERLAADRMPLAGLVLNRVHGSAADQLSAERALSAAETLTERAAEQAAEAADEAAGTSGNAAEHDAESAAGDTSESAAENLPPVGIVDHPTGNADDVPGSGSPVAQERDTQRPDVSGRGEAPQDAAEPAQDGAGPPHGPSGTAGSPVDALAAGLLRLHAERMRVIARERRTRDRFTALHPEVPVAEVAALPADVNDLDGLRAIGRLLADQVPGQPAATGTPS
ncbi:ArsA family ATPase [Streptomyces sp. 549]|uniref:ArsA family ATPase n=1 Tax=Streptomyces sp. 549 TaxID=3049076 RepID=UPI0024C47263|nr:ArsA family ATPase [Streptomyces sp. 549]MDK1475501.1 ArsA family ATPase [Streptomyces sp. 549]